MNMNDHVWVILSDYGWEVHAAYYQDLELDPAVYNERLIDDSHALGWPGYQRFQLWELMRIFGHVCYMGNMRTPFIMNQVNFQNPVL